MEQWPNSGRIWKCALCFRPLRWETTRDEGLIETHERLCASRVQRIASEGKAKELKDAADKVLLEHAKLTNPDFGTW